MRTLNVELSERSYPIHIGPGLLADAELVVSRLPQKRVAIITNTTIGPLYLGRLASGLAARGVECVSLRTRWLSSCPRASHGV